MKAVMSREVKRMKIARVSILLLLMLISILAILPLGKAQYTCTIRPNANGDVTELYPRPTSLQNWECVDETPSDGDGSYVMSCKNGLDYDGIDLYNLPNSLPSNVIIDRVTVFISVRSDSDSIMPESGNWFRTEIKTHGEMYKGTEYFAPKIYTTYSTVYTTNPYTGQDWTKAEVDALQAGVWATTGCNYPCYPQDLLWGRCTQVWVEVQYYVPYGWVSPTGYSDPQGGWTSETNAYDDNENSYALTAVTRRNTWSKFLYLTHSPKTCNKIRILNKDDFPSMNFYYDIDVYKDYSWVGVYYGGSIGNTWKEISFAEGTVSQMRIRLKRVTGPSYSVMRIYEADFYMAG